jgi:carbonic anhydrase
MLPLFLTTGFLLFSGEHEAPKAAPEEKVATEVAKPVKVEAEAKADPNKDAAKKEAPKAPRPVVFRKSLEQQRIAEAEARAARLLAENARIQQEMARATGAAAVPITTPAAALAELQAGNARFVSGKRVRSLLSMQDAELRESLAKGQAPFAIIVTCSDSRLADNLIFDQELGRLFTIREAGNSPDTQGIASAEYAAEHLGSKLVVVLGHTACGAVKAVFESHGRPMPGNLWSLQAAMAGLLEAAPEDPNESTPEYLKRLAETNAQRQAKAMLDRSEILRELAAKGKVKVVPALYDLTSGQVRFLEMPKESGEGAGGHH